MPRSTKEIISHAEELAKQFEDYEPDEDDRDKVSPLTRVRLAALKRSEAEREIAEAVQAARLEGISWAKLGRELGTSGEATRQRYSHA
jgi:hypothetical protein